MLLRLLPIPTPSQPSPPTILFTLPLPTHPYTSRGLPLPANLLAHRSVCVQEDLECSNVLLGEKSSWICGIIDDVTFSLPANNVTIHLIDGSDIVFPLSSECTQSLRRVIHQVQLSFAPPPPQPQQRLSSEASPRSSTSSQCSVASASSSTSPSTSPTSRRSPSSLLFSILSPLLPTSSSHSPHAQSSLPQQAPQPPARVHRRQARSLLVDTYRQHVLPVLKDALPSAYLPWLIATETSKRMADFETLRTDINDLLSTCGVDVTSFTPMKRSRSASTTSSASDSEDSDVEMSPVTPATSVFSPSSCSTHQRSRVPLNPQSFLLSIPPAHSIPFTHRNGYSNQLARLSKLASRLSALKKLQGRYEREEGKRRWLESLERGRQGDRSLRRAFSNGQISAQVNANALPVKRSGLWRSWTADDQERYETSSEEAIHPVMMPLSPVVEASAISDESDDEGCASPPRRRSISMINLPNLPDLSLEDSTEEVIDKVILVHHGQAHRPPLPHRDAEEEVPSLVSSLSDESLAESEEWDDDRSSLDTPTSDSMLLPRAGFARKWEANVVRMIKPDLKLATDWDRHVDEEDRGPNVHVEVFNGVEVVYA